MPYNFGYSGMLEAFFAFYKVLQIKAKVAYSVDFFAPPFSPPIWTPGKCIFMHFIA
jgi:hypothetical protein